MRLYLSTINLMDIYQLFRFVLEALTVPELNQVKQQHTLRAKIIFTD